MRETNETIIVIINNVIVSNVVIFDQVIWMKNPWKSPERQAIFDLQCTENIGPIDMWY